MMRFALMFALLAAPIAAVVALPDVAIAAQRKPKKTAPKAKTNATETKKTVVKEKEPAAEPKVAETPATTAGGVPELRGPTRIDFDDRLIQGQTNKSGAVYLFDRKETGISSMVRRRKSFRQLTLSTIYDR